MLCCVYDHTTLGLPTGPKMKTKQIFSSLQARGSAQANWKPFFFNPIYIVGLITLHILNIVGIQLLIRAHNDAKTDIRIIQHNVTVEETGSIFIFQENDSRSFLLWIYMPVAIATFLGVLWEGLDGAVRRLEPFRQLSKTEGGNVWNAMCLDYTGMFGFTTPYHAIARGHYAVALTSATFVLTTIAIPTLTGGIFNIQWASLSYSSEQTEGPKFATISVDSGFATATQVFHGLAIAAGLVLLFVLYSRPTGLYRDPKGIGGIASLISDIDRSGSGTLRLFRQLPSFANTHVVVRALQGVTFQLRHVLVQNADGTTLRTYQLDTISQPWDTLPVDRNATIYRNDAHSRWLTKRAVWAAEVLLWLGHAAVIGVLYRVAQILGSDGFADRAKVTISKVILTLFITVGGIMWSSIQRNVQLFEPWRQLSRNKPRALYNYLVRNDAISLGLIGSIVLSIARGAMTMLWASFCVVMIQVATVFSPPVLELVYASSAGGNVSSYQPKIGVLSNKAGLVLGALGVAIQLVIFCNLLFLILSRKTRPFLPRAPTTIASQIMYLCRSDRLLMDFARTSMLPQKSVAERLNNIDRKCLFGWFRWRQGPTQYRYVGVEEYHPGEYLEPFHFPMGLNGYGEAFRWLVPI